MSNLSTTSDDILACAKTLIMSGGYNGFSYADIAGVVGIRKASIHHHFPSKVDLVKALIVRHREDTEAGFANLESKVDDPLEQLQAYTQYWSACITDGSAPFCVGALLASEIPVLPQELASEIQNYFRSLSRWLTSVLTRGAKQGRIRLIGSPDIEAEAFAATVHGGMLSARAHSDPKMFSLIVEPMLRRLAAAQ
ncbi:TetR/AcrR family transcriptional regulator [Brucella anthropi]|jgi:TetR/AcrR family transcriptional repressor of nem operon|uniref:TetR/AcrR family transcriptional regulator n=1 Tax=Brucella anthropi TaxID=529 RepID=UPI000287BCDD|nr:MULTISPECIES: TetR/AcrR family transcriptional regulator [Brucella/Ochrobactrum group]PQZ63837.1 TetR/AcrR family transcriptional regulator [Ochrobactrum sp. MYb49]